LYIGHDARNTGVLPNNSDDPEKERVAEIVPVNIFDLKVATSYLNNAFDFIYICNTIIARRLIDVQHGTGAPCLPFKNRLTIPDNIQLAFIDDAFGQHIDADYQSKDKRLALRFSVRIIDDIIDDIIPIWGPSLFRLFSVLRGMSGIPPKN